MSRQNSSLSYFIFGILLISLGSGLVIFRQELVLWLAEILQFILIALGSWTLIEKVRQGWQRLARLELLIALGQILGALWLLQRPEFTTAWLVFIIGLYQVIMGLIGLFQFAILWRDQVQNPYPQLLIAVIHLLFGLSSMLASNRILATLMRLGIYLIFIGITYLNDARLIVQDSGGQNQWRIRIPMPVAIEALIPSNTLVKFNTKLAQLDEKGRKKFQDEVKASQSPQLDQELINVLIHIGKSGFDKIGHVDVSYQGKVYSYGNHDVESFILMGAIGDGVWLEIDEEQYLAFLKSHKTTVVRYGILVGEKERVEFEEKLATIRQKLEPFQLTTERQSKSFLGRLVKQTGAEVYKFVQGRYKTYFVLGTNCVLLADQLIGRQGIDIISLSGILAPGTYYEYFERNFQDRDSHVVSKTFFHPAFPQAVSQYHSKLLEDPALVQADQEQISS